VEDQGANGKGWKDKSWEKRDMRVRVLKLRKEVRKIVWEGTSGKGGDWRIEDENTSPAKSCDRDKCEHLREVSVGVKGKKRRGEYKGIRGGRGWRVELGGEEEVMNMEEIIGPGIRTQ
jgi:hypothetical protein